ncbi:ApeI family dehydratase [Paraglaciecola arctica]|uniref:ApeI family dehydratase n=1 Tax=Paraglaciecola arctica TaxID=1128911 RepID=UPI001C07D9DB|nr:acyl-CoA synthetase [Paraglaciecola arctica]MBU3003492.1 acyl-CoA synthetase [Paraglaciecola arctica]
MSDYVHHGELLSVEKEDNSVFLELKIPANLYYFQGHFPSAPVLPGVVLTHWVVEYASQYFNADPSKFESFSGLKFQIIVGPEQIIKLKLSQINDNKYTFSYHSDHGKHASGKVMFV